MDKVKPLKIENSVNGTQNDEFPTEVNPSEDYIASKGVAFENSDNHFIDKDPGTGQIRMSDPSSGIIKSGDIAANNAHRININNPHDVRATQISDFQTEVAKNTQLITNTKDIMISAMVLQAIVETEFDPSLTFFVDSFDNANLIDPSSTNFAINELEGFVGLIQGGSYTVIDTTKVQFDSGTFSNIESGIMIGGDGFIRKTLVAAGGTNQLEDFEDIANIVTTGSAIQSQCNLPGTVYEGEYSLSLAVNFADSPLNESSITTIDLGVSGVDLSLVKFLKILVLKQGSANIKYDIQLEDIYSSIYSYTQETLYQSQNYQIISKIMSTATGIDKTVIRYVRFRLYEQAEGQVILDIVGSLDDTHIEVNTSSPIYQTFKPTASSECKRIKIRARWEQDQPTAPLFIGLANAFGDSLAVTVIEPLSASASWQDFYLTFDNTINLVANFYYQIKLESATGGNKTGWDVHISSGSVYANGALYAFGSATPDDLHVTLFTPAINETIYLDNLYSEQESTYQQTGTFTSRKINLGIVPSTLSKLYWTEDPGNFDTIRIRIKFASTEIGLDSATWSSWFTDATGTGNNLSGIIPYQYYQYQIEWTGGTTTDSDIIKDVNLDYTAAAGTGSAVIISISSTVDGVPTKFIVNWQDIAGTGTINYYISRDGKNTWQSIPLSQKGLLVDFTSGAGSNVHIKAIVTGNAKIYGWTVHCDKEFV